jgi:HNH endonuclease
VDGLHRLCRQRYWSEAYSCHPILGPSLVGHSTGTNSNFFGPPQERSFLECVARTTYSRRSGFFVSILSRIEGRFHSSSTLRHRGRWFATWEPWCSPAQPASVSTPEGVLQVEANGEKIQVPSTGYEPSDVGTTRGTNFSQAAKQQVWEVNAAANDGVNACTNCGDEVSRPEQSKAGVTPPSNQGEVDHIQPKSQGGAGKAANGQLLCRACNLAKGSKFPWP